MALGILRACYVSWLHQDWSGTGVADTSSTLSNTSKIDKKFLPMLGYEHRLFCH
jgi:hypothetical protein